jgi:hypothetical protein
MFSLSKRRPFSPIAACLGAVLLFASTVALMAVSGPAVAGDDDPGAPSLEQIGQVCLSTLGVSPGEAHYANCVESLSQSQHAFAHAQAVARAREGCLDRGFAHNSPSLAECTLAASETRRPAPPIDTTDNGPHTRSYFYASPNEIHRREEAACTRLGLDPSSGGFGTCVAGLQTSRFAADNPLN